MAGEKGTVRLWALEGLAYAALAGQAFFLVCAAVLIGVPCWFIGRLVVRGKRKKLIAAGGTPPAPPSRLRRVVQGIVSAAMLVAWCALVYAIVSRFTYPVFADAPLAYTESWSATESRMEYSTGKTRKFTDINICPVKVADLSTSALAATCVAAAKYYSGELGHKVRVNISVCPQKHKPYTYYQVKGLNYPWSQSRSLRGISEYCEVGHCVYDPSYDERWPAFAVTPAADNGQPLVNSLWVENEDSYAQESAQEAESSLKKAISDKLSLAPADVSPEKFTLKPVPSFLIPDVPASAPVNLNKRPQRVERK